MQWGICRSTTIAKRRLSFFGHVCRLPEDSPAQKAVQKPRGKSKNTYVATLKKQLKLKGINTIEKAQRIARDRDIWRNILG